MFSRALLLQRGTASAVLAACARSSRIHPHVVRSCPQQVFPLRASRSFSLAQVLRREARMEDDVGRDAEVPQAPPSGSVFIANLPFSVTVEQLEEAFAQFGRVRSVRLREHLPQLYMHQLIIWAVGSPNGNPRGSGFIEFETADEAAAFVESDQRDPIFLLDRDIFVKHADLAIDPRREPNSTLIAQHFDAGMEDFVRDVFSEYSDSVIDVRIRE